MNTIDNQAIINKRPFVSFKFFSKAKLFLNLVSLLVVMFVSGDVIGQVTIFSENMGTPSGTTAIAVNSFQNATLAFSGNADVRNTTISAGYSGSSAGGNIFITSTVGINFQISSINTINCSNLSLSFGVLKTTNASSSSDLIVEVSSDGTNYSSLSYSMISGTGTSNVYSLKTASGTIPSTSNLRIRFRSTTTSAQFRIDDVKLTGNVSVFTWVGTTSNWDLNTNWNPTGIPNGSTNITIPNTAASPVNTTNFTLNFSKTLTLQAGAKLTMSGSLNNNGTVNIGNGATLVQTGSGNNTGLGSYSIKQAISGGTTQSYYIGSPLTSATSSVFTPTSSGGNLMYTYDANQTTPAWTQVIGNSTALGIGKGYVVKMTANDTLNFTGTSINNGSINIPCYRQASGSYLGFNLVSNPYPSYLDWDDVYAGNSATNFQSTIWYRLANSSNNMVFDTYNAPAGTGTNTNGIGAASRYIAPMQAFWVNVPSGGASSANLNLTNAMREHFVSGVAGLRSTAQDFPAFLRLNMIQGNNLDQLIIFAKPEASENFESYDSEKMFLTGVPQFYSTVGSKNLVINGIKNNHRKSAVPLTMVLPNAGMFVFEAEEMHIENGAIILEDRLENTFQDLTLNETYSFQSAAGTISDRFVIHFHLLSPEFVTDDFEVNELSASITDVNSETSEIHVLSNGKGQISVSLPENEMSAAILEVIDASGRTILKKKLIEKESIINLDNCSGIYYVRVASAQNIELQKIFVQP